MPTKEQIERLKVRLDEMRYRVYDCRPGRIPDPVDPRFEEAVIERGHRDFDTTSTGWTTWDRLSNDERRAMLGARLDWQGFTAEQRQRVIERVLDSADPDTWMDGAARSLWDQGGKLVKSLTDQARSAAERYRGREREV